MRKLRELNADLAELFANDGDGSPRPEGDPETLAAVLKKLRAALDSFDGDAALAILNSQTRFAFGQEIDRLLADAQRKAEGFEYGCALAAIDEIDDLIRDPS